MVESVGYYTKQEVAKLYGVTTRTVDVWWRKGKLPKPINHRSRNKERNARQWGKEEVDADLAENGLMPSPVSMSSRLEKAVLVLATRFKGMEL